MIFLKLPLRPDTNHIFLTSGFVCSPPPDKTAPPFSDLQTDPCKRRYHLEGSTNSRDKSRYLIGERIDDLLVKIKNYESFLDEVGSITCVLKRLELVF